MDGGGGGGGQVVVVHATLHLPHSLGVYRQFHLAQYKRHASAVYGVLVGDYMRQERAVDYNVIPKEEMKNPQGVRPARRAKRRSQVVAGFIE